MSLLRQVLSGFGVRATSTLSDPADWLMETLTSGKTASGEVVTVDKAMKLVPVYSAVQLIAGTVGTLPLVVYERLATGGRVRATQHRTWAMLHEAPNPEMAADELWELVTAQLCLWGNAFLYKERDELGLVVALWPLRPDAVQVARSPENSRERVFVVNGVPYSETDVLHIRAMSRDGLVGYSPVQLAKEAIANALAQERFQGKFMANGARPSIILRHPQKLSPEAADRLKRSWNSIRAGDTAVLEEGIEVEQWTMPLNDAQFLEAFQFSDLRIAQLFLIPPGKLGAPTGQSLRYSTVEQESLDLSVYTFRRWCRRIEGALKRDPSIWPQQRHYAEFLMDELLRADTRTRWASYKTAREIGAMTINEIRERENLPPLAPDEADEPADEQTGGR